MAFGHMATAKTMTRNRRCQPSASWPLLPWRFSGRAVRYRCTCLEVCIIDLLLVRDMIAVLTRDSGIPPYIYGDIGGSDRWIWFVLANLLSLAAVCPFVGSISDLMGRRWVAIMGCAFIIVGMVICSTAQSMNIFIGGMVFAGIGAGVGELTALAVTSELAPTSQRGKYVAILILTIIPFCPSVMWGQLIASHSSWRYVGVICGGWALIGLIMTFVFYHPDQRPNTEGQSRAEIIKQIDFVGGFLSVTGMITFMIGKHSPSVVFLTLAHVGLPGMQWGGYQYPWGSVHVLVPLLLGVVLLIAFIVWEGWFAQYPMFPKRLQREPRTLALTLIITFVSGANFFSILMFWPTQAFNVYGHDPVGVGLRGMPIGFSILTGACVVLWLLSVFRGHNRELMIVSCVLMTAGCGSLAIAEIDNLYKLWGLLVLAGLGIGGIVVPASVITMIICPDDLIATVAALTLSVRVIGGSIGYCVYYNVFVANFIPAAKQNIGVYMVYDLHIYDLAVVKQVIELTGASLLDDIAKVPALVGRPEAVAHIILAGQLTFAEAYKYVYYTSIAFGSIAIIAACFLGNIRKYMDDHVAVVMH